MISLEEARSRLELAGQSHLLRFWPELSADERDSFLGELSQLEPEELREHCRAAAEAGSRDSGAVGLLDQRMEPMSAEFIGSVSRSDQETLKEWEDEGGSGDRFNNGHINIVNRNNTQYNKIKHGLRYSVLHSNCVAP